MGARIAGRRPVRAGVYSCQRSSFPRMREIQYAAASRFNHWRLWNTGSAFALRATADRSPARTPRSRGMVSPEALQIRWPSPNRGRRESRVPTAPAVSCAKSCAFGAHEHTGSAETARPSPRNGFTAYFVLSPVSGLFCHRHLQDRSTSLAPASRRQDHTTSPYASVQSSAEPKRPSHSGPRIVTIAKRPSDGPGCAKKCQ